MTLSRGIRELSLLLSALTSIAESRGPIIKVTTTALVVSIDTTSGLSSSIHMDTGAAGPARRLTARREGLKAPSTILTGLPALIGHAGLGLIVL